MHADRYVHQLSYISLLALYDRCMQIDVYVCCSQSVSGLVTNVRVLITRPKGNRKQEKGEKAKVSTATKQKR
jgi:hypothetical protein